MEADYAPRGGRLEGTAASVSQTGEAADVRRQNLQESAAWYSVITTDMFAKTAPGGQLLGGSGAERPEPPKADPPKAEPPSHDPLQPIP
jgi:hypothetical protein